MQEQLLNELKALAEKTTALDNNANVTALKEEAQKLYEKLSVLDFVSQNIQTIATSAKTTEMKVEEKEEKVVQQVTPKEAVSKPQEVVVKTQIEEVVEQKTEVAKPTMQTPPKPSVQAPVAPKEEKAIPPTEKVDINNYLSTDDVDTIFDENQWEIKDPAQRSLNSKLKPETITVGLNDRIGFVNHLFNFSQSDFNRVLSQLNTIDNEQKARDFINKMVKPEYDWTGKEEYEQRLFDLIARRFS